MLIESDEQKAAVNLEALQRYEQTRKFEINLRGLPLQWFLRIQQTDWSMLRYPFHSDRQIDVLSTTTKESQLIGFFGFWRQCKSHLGFFGFRRQCKSRFELEPSEESLIRLRVSNGETKLLQVQAKAQDVLPLDPYDLLGPVTLKTL